jgi:hypothetical protein
MEFIVENRKASGKINGKKKTIDKKTKKTNWKNERDSASIYIFINSFKGWEFIVILSGYFLEVGIY